MKTKLVLFFISFFISVNFYAQEYKTGLNFNDGAYEKIPMCALLVKGEYDLPAKASLEQYCPTPGSQGQYGTCVGWATAYGARTIIYALQNDLKKGEIDGTAFSPSWVYNQIKTPDDNNCQGGSSIREALELMRDDGAAKLEDLEYKCDNTVPADVKVLAKDYKIRDCIRIFGLSSDKEIKMNTVKKAISEKHPVIIGFNIPNSFFYIEGDIWKPAVNDNPKVLYGGHAMLVVGYDDTKYGGAIRIMNSWGTAWGDNGFVWVKYDDFANFCKYAYEVIEYPAKKVLLAGEVEFKLLNGSQMIAIPKLKSKGLVVEGEKVQNDALIAYEMTKAYQSGTKFKFYIKNNRAAYVYALASDLSGKITTIFPYKDGISPYLGYSSNTLVIPSENSYIKMDSNPGKDFLCVFYSKHPLEIEKLKVRMEAISGISFREKITKIFGDVLVPYNKIDYKKDKIEFDAEISDDKNYVIPLMIEIEHK